MYTVDYFIKKFESIPEWKWNSNVQYEEHDNTRCAFGHCAPSGQWISSYRGD